MSNVPTPHIKAKMGEIAEKILMPGDPLRAKFIAENYLSDAVCVNDTRNMLGFTGNYKGSKVTVMGSGMGVSSIGIYSYELFNFYEAETIIRIGTAGALVPQVQPRDVIIAQGACHDTNVDRQYGLPGTYAPIADFGLVKRAYELATEKNIKAHVGNVLTGEVYYDASNSLSAWSKMGVLAVEMEAAALYMNAAAAATPLTTASFNGNLADGSVFAAVCFYVLGKNVKDRAHKIQNAWRITHINRQNHEKIIRNS